MALATFTPVEPRSSTRGSSGEDGSVSDRQRPDRPDGAVCGASPPTAHRGGPDAPVSCQRRQHHGMMHSALTLGGSGQWSRVFWSLKAADFVVVHKLRMPLAPRVDALDESGAWGRWEVTRELEESDRAFVLRYT